MRAVLFIMVGFLAGIFSCHAQEKVVQTFSGSKNLTTPLFKISDKWEIRWSGASAITITLRGADGSILAGTTASADGSLYEPKGGMVYLQITSTPAVPNGSWQVTGVEMGAVPAAGTAASTAYVPPIEVAPPASVGVATNTVAAPAVPPPAPASDSAAKLSEEQARAIVLIKGDIGEGTGFLTHSADGTPVAITNIHVISANPNIHITTIDGREIPVLAYKGAVDRDLVMMTIKDDHYTYLNLATDIDHLVHEDDEVLTPGNSEGGEVFLDTKGEVRGIGPEKIEFSNPIYHGNSGGPVLQVSSGKVIAVVEGAIHVRPSDGLDRASLSNTGSAIAGSYRYFGLRIDTVPSWETYDLGRFLTETTFLEQFHTESRCLDSLMNGSLYERAHLPVGTADDELPSAHFFQTDDRLKTAEDNFRQQAVDADKSQQMDARRELYSDIADVAGTGIDMIQKTDNFYGFDRLRAKEELAYRQALQKELNRSSDHLDEMGH